MVGVVAVVFLASSSSGGISLLSALVPIISVLAGLATVVGAIVMYQQGRESRVKAAEKRREDIRQLARDFYGDERPGVPPRPGVLEVLEGLADQVAVIHAEITPNHGGSIKDVVTSMNVRMGVVETDLKVIHDKMDGQSGVSVNVHT